MAQYFLMAGDSAVTTMFWLVGMGVFGFVLVCAALWGIAYLVVHLVKKFTGTEQPAASFDDEE